MGPGAAVLYMVGMLLVLIFGIAVWTYPFWVLAFIFLALWLPHSPWSRRLGRLDESRIILLLFLLALALRWVLLPQDQILSADIQKYQYRSQAWLDGQIPYQDYAVLHPPAYIVLLTAIAWACGAKLWVFRAFFSFIDALVVVVIYKLAKRWNGEAAPVAALTYALYPLTITVFGIGGHYDSLVVLCVMSGYLAHLQGRSQAGVFLLGVGFALKLYPVFLLPFLLWGPHAIKSLRGRLTAGASFALPMVLTALPLALLAPKGLALYWRGQAGEWDYIWSFTSGLGWMFGYGDVTASLVGWTFLVLALVLMTLAYASYYQIGPVKAIWRRFPRRLEDPLRASVYWTRVALYLYALLLVVLVASLPHYLAAHGDPLDWSPSWVVGVLIGGVLLAVVLPLLRFRMSPWLAAGPVGEGEVHLLPIYSALVLTFLVLGAPDLCAWYYPWALAFVVLIQSPRIRYTLLFLPLYAVG